MTLILLEALGAGLLLVLIVWWTMFNGRDGGEPPREPSSDVTGTDDSPTVRTAAGGQEKSQDVQR